MMMEPADFHSNPQTMATNQYQEPDPDNVESVQEAAVREFRNLRDTLVENGVIVTTACGQKGCPDDIFCNNWVSTHFDRRMVLYPMLAENRRTERRPELLKVLRQHYDVALDLSEYERQGRFLESTGSLAMDRVNHKIYCALSPRSDQGLAEEVAKTMNFEMVFFNTNNHVGKPVYHSDVMMFLGTGYVGICSACILEEDRSRVLNCLAKDREVIDLSMDQIRSFCGNALELRGRGDKKILAMSSAANNVSAADDAATVSSP